jgi:hypothetical protein
MPKGLEQDEAGSRDLIRQLIYTAIWTSYFVKSERVRATFTQTRNKEIAEQ